MTPPRSKRARLEPPTSTSSVLSSPSSNHVRSTQATPPRPPSGSPESNDALRLKERVETFAQVTSLSHSYLLREMPLSEVYYVPAFITPSQAEEWYQGLLSLDSWYQPKLKVYGREVTQSRKIAAYSTDPTLTLKYSGQTVDMRYSYPPLLRLIQDQVEDLLGVRFNHVMLNLYEDGGVYIGNHRDNLENKVIASLSLGAPRTFIMTRDHKVKPPSKSHSNTTQPTSSSSSSSSSSSTKSKVKPKPQRKRKLDSAVEERDEEKPENNDSKRRSPCSCSENGDGSVGRKAGANADRAGSMNKEPVYVDKKSWILSSGSLVVMQGETQRYWKHQIPKEPKVKDGRISLTFRQLVNGASP